MLTHDPGADPNEGRVSRRAWGLLAFLTLLNVLNFVDRTLISSLAPLLIQDLGLSRAQIGLLAGFGFVFFYSLVGLFLGLMADRFPRIPLVAAGLGLWSAMTALSGLARSFVQLAIPRIFVGIGEATLTPSALSMLGDVFPRRRLAMATGIYYAGIPIGTATSLMLASYLAPRYGWRFCFIALGLLGIVAALLMLLFKEPARIGQTLAAEKPDFGKLAREALGALVTNRALALTLIGGSCLCYGAGSALLAVTWLVEDRGFTYADAAWRAGIIAGLAGFLGNWLVGTFGDWFARRSANGHLRSLIPITLFFTPMAGLFYWQSPDTPFFYLCWFFTAAGTSAWFGPLFAAIQQLAPQSTRATTVAVALLVLNLLGVAPGALVTGWLGDERNLTFGLLSSLAVTILAIVPFTLALRVHRRN
jgi:MFS transporter, Spinster family, sphingosine-1-phosphate transporter